MGAVIAAYLPSLLAGVARPTATYGWHFHLAIEALQHLHGARSGEAHGLSAGELGRALGTAKLQLEPVLQALVGLDWVARLDEAEHGSGADAEARYVLLADPESTPLAPLFERLLVDRSAPLAGLWDKGRWDALRLRDAL